LIWDFNTGIDQIQLGGSADDYVLNSAPAGLRNGTAIYHTKLGETDEFIGLVDGVFGLSLASDDFVYDSLLA